MQDQFFFLCFFIKMTVNVKDMHYYWNDAKRIGSIFAKSYAKIDSGSRGEVSLTLHIGISFSSETGTVNDFAYKPCEISL